MYVCGLCVCAERVLYGCLLLLNRMMRLRFSRKKVPGCRVPWKTRTQLHAKAVQLVVVICL
jgi:hypothetical protein